MNTELMRQVAFEIEFAGRLNMDNYAQKDDPVTGRRRYNDEISAEEVLNDCGTTACIAGWTNAVLVHDDMGDHDHAAEALGLTPDQAEELFFGGNNCEGSVWTQIGVDDGWAASAVEASKLLRALADGEVTFVST